MPSLSPSLTPALKCVIKPYLSPLEYWMRIIRVAKNLKSTIKENKQKCLHLFDTKHVTFLCTKPHGRFEVAYSIACDLLGARRTLYCDPNFENHIFPNDSGRVLSLLTDMVIFHGLHQDVLRKTISKMEVPVFSASCNVYCFHSTLSDMMTFLEVYEQLEGLTLAWIGPPMPTFNSYLILCSKFKIKVQYLCMCKFGSGRMSPIMMQPIEEMKDVKEFQTVEETVSGAHIVATAMHPDEGNKITRKIFKKADPKCVFIHSLPRGLVEVTDEVFNEKNNLCWKTTENYIYIAMAIILTNLENLQSEPSKCHV